MTAPLCGYWKYVGVLIYYWRNGSRGRENDVTIQWLFYEQVLVVIIVQWLYWRMTFFPIMKMPVMTSSDDCCYSADVMASIITIIDWYSADRTVSEWPGVIQYTWWWHYCNDVILRMTHSCVYCPKPDTMASVVFQWPTVTILVDGILMIMCYIDPWRIVMVLTVFNSEYWRTHCDYC